MNENEYRKVYQEINQTRCIFEKSINNRRCDCTQKQIFLLATREGVGCRSKKSLQRCTQYLNTIRKKSRFALRMTFIASGPLPHNKELKVQAGGCLALQALLSPAKINAKKTTNIDGLMQIALANYHTIDNFPYSELIRGVLHYKSRAKRQRKIKR